MRNLLAKCFPYVFGYLKTEEVKVQEEEKRSSGQGFFSTDITPGQKVIALDMLIETAIPVKPENVKAVALGTMDDSYSDSIKQYFNENNAALALQTQWYAGQGFIGYQLCAIFSQNWLINKACTVPAKDAIRKGYEITVNDGSVVPPEIIEELRKRDRAYRVNANLLQFVRMGRIYGIRIVMFEVAVKDRNDYYFKPFNIDGIKPGSYKGISQIDPYWISPELDTDAAANPDSIHFYEPTWWRVGSLRVHRTHLIIMRGEEVADILKPSYFFGGLSVPQKIYERVYAAERIANEAPQLALTKRTSAVNVNIGEALAVQGEFEERMAKWAYNMNNYAIKILGEEEKIQQFDTSLTDLDNVIMTQYQIVAAASNVPATKLLGTSPKGFNATGEFEEKSYHEELESIQEHDLTPLLERHYLLLIKSEIAPEFSIAPFSVTPKWNPTDSVTAKTQAEINKFKAETGAIAVSSGAINGADERQRLISDPHSGYNGLALEMEEDEFEEETETDIVSE